jgi:hypothetical protein
MIKVQWIPPDWCLPPHRVARENDVIALANDFVRYGWNPEKPALIGYLDNDVQLLTGSHRWAAARLAELPRIPVVIYLYHECYEAFGDLERWLRLLQAPPAGMRP